MNTRTTQLKAFDRLLSIMDELLLFELMQDKIWEGAKNDSLGLKSFYEANKKKYFWPCECLNYNLSNSQQ